jgi:hypothetical protein
MLRKKNKFAYGFCFLKQNVGFQKNIKILIEKEEAGFQGACWVYSILQCLVVGAPKTLSQIC